MSVKLGKTYTDQITGFTGTATSRTEYLFGCVRIGLQPTELRDGKPLDVQVFDEAQLDSATEKGSSSGPGGLGDPLPRPQIPR